MRELVFQSEFSNVDMKKACKALSRRRQKTVGFWAGPWALFFQAALLVVIAIVANRLIESKLLNALTPLLLIFGICGFVFVSSRKAQASIYDSPIRAGITNIRLSPEGYHTEHPGCESLMRWSHVPDVLVTNQGLLLVHSDYEYYPIESKAFRDHDEMVATAEQIKSWIRAARQL